MTDNKTILKNTIAAIEQLEDFKPNDEFTKEDLIECIINDINFVIADLEQQPTILYLCDEKQCENGHCDMCHHTCDIRHAKNFKCYKHTDGSYWEQTDEVSNCEAVLADTRPTVEQIFWSSITLALAIVGCVFSVISIMALIEGGLL